MNNLFFGKSLSKGMKKTFVLLSGAALALSSCTQSSSNFSGTITGVESDTLLVFVDQMNPRKHLCTDTVALVNDRFEMQVPDSAVYIRLLAKPAAPNGAVRMAQGMPILYFPGNKLRVEV